MIETRMCKCADTLGRKMRDSLVCLDILPHLLLVALCLPAAELPWAQIVSSLAEGLNTYCRDTPVPVGLLMFSCATNKAL